MIKGSKISLKPFFTTETEKNVFRAFRFFEETLTCQDLLPKTHAVEIALYEMIRCANGGPMDALALYHLQRHLLSEAGSSGDIFYIIKCVTYGLNNLLNNEDLITSLENMKNCYHIIMRGAAAYGNEAYLDPAGWVTMFDIPNGGKNA
jgi:hypothetical protein